MPKAKITPAQRKALIAAVVALIGAIAFGIRQYFKAPPKGEDASLSVDQSDIGAQQQVVNTGTINGGVTQVQGADVRTPSK